MANWFRIRFAVCCLSTALASACSQVAPDRLKSDGHNSPASLAGKVVSIATVLLAMAAGPLILVWSGVELLKQPIPWIGLLGMLWTIGGVVSFWLYLRGSRTVKEDQV